MSFFHLHNSLDGLNLQVLREDKRGFGILVSSVPKESHAAYSLVDPSEVNSLFYHLLHIKLHNWIVFIYRTATCCNCFQKKKLVRILILDSVLFQLQVMDFLKRLVKWKEEEALK